MTPDEDALRRRLGQLLSSVPLATASTVQHVGAVRPRFRRQAGSLGVVGGAMLVLVTVLLMGQSIHTPAAPPASTTLPSIAPSSPQTLSRADAVALARGQVQPDATLTSADLGTYGSFALGSATDPSTTVWVVRFWVVFPYCLPGPSPEPSPCATPAPGPWTVIVNATTGSIVASLGGSGS